MFVVEVSLGNATRFIVCESEQEARKTMKDFADKGVKVRAWDLYGDCGEEAG